MKYKTERELNQDTLLRDGDYTTNRDVVERIARYIPDRQVLADLDEYKNIRYYTALDIYKLVSAIGGGLMDMGLEGKHIAICADNSVRYILCDIAVSGVGVVTPIDRDATPELMTTLLNKIEADAVICSADLIEKITEVQKGVETLQTIITIDKKVEGYTSLDEVMERGQLEENEHKYIEREIDLDAPAKILFTSGTTGPNKAVVLTQRNIAANIMNCMDMIKTNDVNKNTSMSVLPMHHATEINTHIFTRVACGRLTYINDHMKNMMTNIKIFKPYVITIVPMIANMFYKTIWINAKKAGKAEKLKKGIKLCNLFKKMHIDITHKLLKDVFAPFGGNLNQIVCGGAMLNPETVKGMSDLGVFMNNGYGITECGPLISMNTDTFHDYKSVGIQCPNLSVKLDEMNADGVGELCVKGDSVSLGYYKDEEATKEVFDEDGYFHTGDLAYFDGDKIVLSGRKKYVIILENGKNVCPEEIENEVANNIEYATECVAYMEEYGKDKVNSGICLGLYIEDEEIRKNRDKIKADLQELNKTLPLYKNVNYVNIVDAPYPKTSTKKIKRDKDSINHNKTDGIIL